ncbi:MAG TPA: hypothetical protein VFZ09_23165 [Archangium sp.]|uniref:hypothetical protein n=1 Tax=Archangium sp. TaxID=1872627 RepID=UPI002E32E59C|nr:hypothetical protein [Archangium sp.]HEX5749162.1 hypothetical protein [Archangium sp.]
MTGRAAGLRMEGHHKVGPLPYAPVNEVVKLGYLFINGSGASQPFMTSVYDSAGQPTPVPFVPAIYFKASVLNRLFGLRFDGVWEEVAVNSSNGAYTPSKYRYFAMAWMRQDLGWGVGLYSRATLGQATNFVAQRFSAQGTNNLSVVDQTLGTLGPYASVGREPHLAVGNLGTIKSIFDQVYNSGK